MRTFPPLQNTTTEIIDVVTEVGNKRDMQRELQLRERKFLEVLDEAFDSEDMLHRRWAAEMYASRMLPKVQARTIEPSDAIDVEPVDRRNIREEILTLIERRAAG